MEIDPDLAIKLIKGARIITAKLVLPHSLYLELDTGMLLYIYTGDPDSLNQPDELQFDFNWAEGYECFKDTVIDKIIKKAIKTG